jgi:hypothetical protein
VRSYLHRTKLSADGGEVGCYQDPIPVVRSAVYGGQCVGGGCTTLHSHWVGQQSDDLLLPAAAVLAISMRRLTLCVLYR